MKLLAAFALIACCSSSLAEPAPIELPPVPGAATGLADSAAPLAIVISGTGSDANTSKLSVLRAILYGAGYHVLTVPSPTFPGFIMSASSTGVAGDLMQDGHD